MIIVIGSATVRADAAAEALGLCQTHVERSRREAGCVRHGVHIDNEDPGRLVFVEYWRSLEDLQKHFEVPESLDFVKQLGRLSVSAPAMEIFQSEPLAWPT